MSLDVTETAEEPQNGEPERRYRAPALEKGLDILELLASHGAPMTPSQIAVRLERSMSELFRMIQVLEYKGYIAPAETGDGYELSNKLFALGMARAPVKVLLEAALPIMRELSLSVRQSCHLAVASEDQMVVLARIENPGQLGFSVRPGHRRNLTLSPSGVVLYGFQPPEVQETMLRTIRAGGQVDARTIDAFKARVAVATARGYELSASRYIEGVTDISAPIMSGPSCLAALTIPYVNYTPVVVTLEQAVEPLLGAARRLSADTGLTI